MRISREERTIQKQQQKSFEFFEITNIEKRIVVSYLLHYLFFSCVQHH